MKYSMEVSNYCPKEKKSCVKWIDEYFKDCLCNLKDEISFGFGIISLISWGVAEIPQILTNFKTKSGHGVSLAFLSTWVVGDIFNLVGCILEPATLPTQYYTALLYTTTTIVLVLQCIYYDHFLRRWKCRQIETNDQIRDEIKPLNSNSENPSTTPTNSPVDVPYRRDYFSYMSLSRSTDTPSSQSYMKAKSGPCAFEHQSCSSSEDEKPSTLFSSSRKAVSKPRSIPRSLGYGTFLAISSNLPLQSKAIMDGYMKLSGRTLLNEHEFQHNNVYGQWLGWAMAGIYMGGRIPQIWLNIKRGNVEGLNPLMFVFALVANATYVGSILVRSTEWEKIKANLPWLLDAIVCVGLDLFIILQYIYYRYLVKKKHHCSEQYYQDYEKANKYGCQ